MWEQFNALPHQSLTKDIQYVTKWLKLNTHREGVTINTLLEHATLKPEARYIMAYSYSDYTTNIPLNNLRIGKAFVGLRYKGDALSARTRRTRPVGSLASAFLEECQVD